MPAPDLVCPPSQLCKAAAHASARWQIYTNTYAHGPVPPRPAVPPRRRCLLQLRLLLCILARRKVAAYKQAKQVVEIMQNTHLRKVCIAKDVWHHHHAHQLAACEGYCAGAAGGRA